MKFEFLYTIAEITNECFGHGHYENVTAIRKVEDSEFPPLFRNKKNAEEYLKHKGPMYSDSKIVALKVFESIP